MFGSKQGKRARLERIVELLNYSSGITQAELARQLGVAKSTIQQDLQDLEAEGILIMEDGHGYLEIFENSWD